MGGSHGIPLPRYSCCIRPQNPDNCRENHAEVYRRHHRTASASSKSLPPVGSASFSATATDQSCLEANETFGLLDINTATPEELMTLPGINRITACNIVDYRRQLGSFRKIEDMALVPGVGATRFGHVRAEIYASSRVAAVVRSSSVVSSVTSSGIDVMMDLDNVSHIVDEHHVTSPTGVRVAVLDLSTAGSPLDDTVIDGLAQALIKYRLS